MSLYAVYDRATKKVIRQGIAADAFSCGLQITNPATQDVVSADDAETLSAEIEALGLK